MLWCTVRPSLPSELEQKSGIGPHIAPIHVGDKRHTVNGLLQSWDSPYRRFPRCIGKISLFWGNRWWRTYCEYREFPNERPVYLDQKSWSTDYRRNYPGRHTLVHCNIPIWLQDLMYNTKDHQVRYQDCGNRRGLLILCYMHNKYARCYSTLMKTILKKKFSLILRL